MLFYFFWYCTFIPMFIKREYTNVRFCGEGESFMAKKKGCIQLTYVGIFVHPDETFTQILDELMRKFLSSKRYCLSVIYLSFLLA